MHSMRLAVLLGVIALPLFASSPQPLGGFGPTDSYAPQVAGDGSGFYLTWAEYDGTPQYRLYGSRVSQDGMLLDGGGVLLSAENLINPRLKFDGTHYVVAFATQHVNDTSIRVLSISPETGAVTRDVRVPDAKGYDLALEVSPTAAFLAWLDDDSSIQLARISRETGAVERASIPILGAGYPALSWNGSSLLVAWNQMRVIIGSPTFVVPEAVYAVRVSDTLAVLDATPLLIDTVDGAGGMDESAPSAASDGQGWIVAWGQASSIRAAQVSADGVRGTVAQIALGEAPLVFRNGDGYSLAWSEPVAPTSDVRKLFLAPVITTDGQLRTSSAVTVGAVPFFGGVSSVSQGSQRDVAVAWHGATAPEFDWQASFRILDPSATRRRSVRHH